MPEELKFKNKDLIETGHFKNELYNIYRKNLDFVLEILEKGEYEKESKEKVRVEKKTKKGVWELVYAETDKGIVLIHLKLVR